MSRRVLVRFTAIPAIALAIALATPADVGDRGSREVANEVAVAATSQQGGDTGRNLTASPADDAKAESISVHGRWVIEVREPNGALVSRQDFENALTLSGGQVLPLFLARDYSVGLWIVHMYTRTGQSPCLTGGGCQLREPESTYVADDVFKTLSVDVPSSGPNATKLVLAGTATAQADGEIGTVATLVGRCASTYAPATPCFGDYWPFTQKDLSTPVTVATGQQILVTVVISFQ